MVGNNESTIIHDHKLKKWTTNCTRDDFIRDTLYAVRTLSSPPSYIKHQHARHTKTAVGLTSVSTSADSQIDPNATNADLNADLNPLVRSQQDSRFASGSSADLAHRRVRDRGGVMSG